MFSDSASKHHILLEFIQTNNFWCEFVFQEGPLLSESLNSFSTLQRTLIWLRRLEINLALQWTVRTCPGETSTAELINKMLLFNIVDVHESLLLTLANGELSSESVEEPRFILGHLEFPFSHTGAFSCGGLNSSLKPGLKSGAWQTVRALSKTLQLLNEGKLDPGIPLTSGLNPSTCLAHRVPACSLAVASH